MLICGISIRQPFLTLAMSELDFLNCIKIARGQMERVTQTQTLVVNTSLSHDRISSGSRNFGEGGPRNMKYKPLPRGDHLFLAYFYRLGGGGHGPLAPPPGSATANPSMSISMLQIIYLLMSRAISFPFEVMNIIAKF